MKFKNIAVGFAVGVTGGMLVSFLNAPKSGSELQQSLKNESGNFKSQMNQLKIEADEVKSSLLKTKHESSGILRDRKSTRLNSSHVAISYAVFCLKKKKIN